MTSLLSFMVNLALVNRARFRQNSTFLLFPKHFSFVSTFRETSNKVRGTGYRHFDVKL